MKLIVALIFTLSTQTFAGIYTPEIIECDTVFEGSKILLTPTSSSYFNGVEKKCAKHSKLQFEWEDFAYYTINIGGETLSGVACGEDVIFEFKAAQKYKNQKVTLFIYLDEMLGSRLTIGNKSYDVDCSYIN